MNDEPRAFETVLTALLRPGDIIQPWYSRESVITRIEGTPRGFVILHLAGNPAVPECRRFAGRGISAFPSDTFRRVNLKLLERE